MHDVNNCERMECWSRRSSLFGRAYVLVEDLASSLSLCHVCLVWVWMKGRLYGEWRRSGKHHGLLPRHGDVVVVSCLGARMFHEIIAVLQCCLWCLVFMSFRPVAAVDMWKHGDEWING